MEKKTGHRVVISGNLPTEKIKALKNYFLRLILQQSFGEKMVTTHKLGAVLVTAKDTETVRRGFSPQRASVFLFLLKKKNQAVYVPMEHW